mgnify:CR=1 FL=1
MALVIPKRVAVLWGGGLGDMLVIRPLLRRMNEQWGVRPHYLSRAIHFPDLFPALGLDVTLHQLPSHLPEVIREVRKHRGNFDAVYTGGKATLKTRLLGHLMATGSLWNLNHNDCSPFIQEQVLAECRALGLGGFSIDELVEETKNWCKAGAETGAVDGRYLVLHPSSKDGWQTKDWPDQNWRELARHLNEDHGQTICLVGTPKERPRLEQLVEGIVPADRAQVLTTLSVPGLFRLVERSAGVICHNSGLLHVAVQLGKKTLCLNGSSGNFWRAPYPWVENIDSGQCSLRCNRYRCPVPGFDARCIKGVGVARVLDRARYFLLDDKQAR